MDTVYPPKFLYKYYPPERIDILESLKVSFTLPTRFNDPFELNPLEPNEMRFDSKNIDNSINRINKKYNMNFQETMANYFQKQHVQRIENSFGIFCLSEDNKNLLMWAHYASSHTGFIIEFIQDEIFFETTGAPLKVNYVINRKTIDYDNDEKYMEHLYTKSIDWKYESEYRIIEATSELSKYTPVKDLTLYMKNINPKSISSIVIGYKMSDTNKEQIKDILKKDMFKHIKLFESNLHTRIFSLTYKEIRYHILK